jgi:hypothetical protein
MDSGECNALSYFLSRQLQRSQPRHIGIIQTHPEHLARALKSRPSLSRSRQEFRQGKVTLALVGAYTQATNEVAKAIKAREELARIYKDLGIKTNFPPIIPYDRDPVARLAEELDLHKLPLRIGFEGAVW